MLIAQISDSHLTLPEDAELDRGTDLIAAVDFINALEVQPELVVHSGDVSHNGLPDEYAHAREILDRLRAPLVAIPGNRDNRHVMRKRFTPAGSEMLHDEFLQYSIACDDDRVVLLDTLSSNGNLGQLCAERLQHLAEMLNGAREERIAIFMHHPPFEVATIPQPFQFEDERAAREFDRIVRRDPRVRFIACGHVHRPFRTTFAGVSALTLPALAADLRKGRPVNMAEMVHLHRLGH